MLFPLLASLGIVPAAENKLRKDLQNGAYSRSVSSDDICLCIYMYI